MAHQLGAPASASPEEQVAFLRGISADAIEAFLMNNTVNGGPSLYFSAQDDGKFVFSPAEYVARGKAGQFANVVSFDQSVLLFVSKGQPLTRGNSP